MEKIHIFCDSAADIPEPLVRKHGIEIVPITIAHEGRTFREYYDTTPEQYWKLLESSEEIPTTSQITPTQVLETYRKAHENGCTHVIGIIISGKGSGSYQSCCIARDLFYDECGDAMHIEVVDSLAYSVLYGRVVLGAAEMRDQGESFDAIMSVVRSRLNRVEAALGVYTLKHLRKSGRVSGAAAIVGEALGVKPICHVYDGEVNVAEKVRGDKNVIPKLVKFVEKRAVNIEHQTAALLYGSVDEALIEDLEKRLYALGFQAVERWPIGVAVTTNTGPKAIAVAYYGAPRGE